MKKLHIALIIIFVCSVSAFAAKAVAEPSAADKATLEKYGKKYAQYMKSGISYKMSSEEVKGKGKEKEKTPSTLISNKGNKVSFAIETGEKGKTITFFNMDDNTGYQYFSETNTAIKIPFSSKKADDSNVTAQIDNALEITVGDKDTVNNYKCQWITVKNKKKDVSKACYTEDYGVPTVVESKKMVINFTDFSTKVKDSDVTMPASAEVTELSLKGLMGKANKEAEAEKPKSTAKETAKSAASGAAGEVKDTGKEVVSDVKNTAKDAGKNAATGALKGLFGL